MKSLRVLGVVAALALYGFSLYLPAFECENMTSFTGFEILITGWIGIPNFDFRWLGNVTFVVMITCLLRDRDAKKLIDSPRLLFLPFVTALLCLWSAVAPAIVCWGGEFAKPSDIRSLGAELWLVSLCLTSSLFVICSIWDTSARTKDG